MRRRTLNLLFAGIIAIAISPAFGSFATRQNNVPECALTCIANADLGGCAATDNVCLCNSKVFIDSIETCFDYSCQGQDLADAKAFAKDVCQSVGVTIPCDE